MYGKHFESMYEGSMYGAGVAVFAVWGYVIAHVRKSRVELNPKKLSDTLGGTQDEILEAIRVLMSPDPASRHKEHEGRRLLKEGEFQYFVPSWEAYQGIRNADDRRAYNAAKQKEYRARKKQVERDGAIAGGTQAVKEGLEEQNAQQDREQQVSPAGREDVPVVPVFDPTVSADDAGRAASQAMGASARAAWEKYQQEKQQANGGA